VAPVSPYLSCTGDLRAGLYTPDVASTSVEQKGRIMSLDVLAVFFLTEARMLLAFLAVSVYCF